MVEHWTEECWGESNILNVTEKLDFDYCFRIEITLSSSTKKLNLAASAFKTGYWELRRLYSE
jgi:hypothetical protein